MPRFGRHRQRCAGQQELFLRIARNARGRFTRVIDGLPFQLVAVRRDSQGRFMCLSGW